MEFDRSSLVRTNVRKNDMIKIISGREKGKTGKVLKIIKKDNKLLVEKLNLMKRHTKPTKTSIQGGIIEKEAPLHLSNVMLLCPKCNDGVRVGFKVVGNKKQRVCKSCNEVLGK